MKMKKLASLFLVLMMVVGMVGVVYAEETEEVTATGSITINDAEKDQTYTIYQILYLESYAPKTDEEGNEVGTYAYKATDAWKDFVNSSAILNTYLRVENGYVSWVDGASVENFAKLAQAYAKENKLPNQGEKKAETNVVKFTGIELGYYLVDTTLGTLCSLDTTNPDVVMEEKNQAPTVTKEVQEDTDSSWGATNDADINQTVNFKATVTVQAGAENYTLHDTMSAGLTYTGVTAVKIGETVVDAANYTVTSTGLTDGCTFEVAFNNNYIATIAAGTEIDVFYSATVNDKAVVGLPGNPNTVNLQYGDKNQLTTTPNATTTTYTWDMEVLKYANGNKETVLEGVKFALLNKAKNKVATVENGKFTGWVDVPASYTTAAIDDWNEKSILTTDATGKISIDGLDADTYYLHELATLPGYNLLANDVEVVITGSTTGKDSALTYQTVVAEIENKSGTELPETGGIGTTLFYIAGSILVVGALVLMITKRRVTEK